jgi:membrane protein DedA with SNARE-associated domain
MTDLLIHLGYVALFIGTFLEGETVLLLAAFLAHRGYLNIYLVVGVATLGTILGDQVFYFIGRKRGMAFLDRRPWWKSKTLRAQALIRRHELLIILTFRFLYGLRNIIPFALGVSGTRPHRFVPFNIAAAAVWAAVIGGLGYSLGEVAASVLGKARKYELVIAGAIAVVGAVAWSVHIARNRWRRGNRG